MVRLVSEGQGGTRRGAPQHPGVGAPDADREPRAQHWGQPSARKLGAAGPGCGSALGAEEHRSLRRRPRLRDFVRPVIRGHVHLGTGECNVPIDLSTVAGPRGPWVLHIYLCRFGYTRTFQSTDLPSPLPCVPPLTAKDICSIQGGNQASPEKAMLRL